MAATANSKFAMPTPAMWQAQSFKTNSQRQALQPNTNLNVMKPMSAISVMPGSKRQRFSNVGNYNPNNWSMFSEEGDENSNMKANMGNTNEPVYPALKKPQIQQPNLTQLEYTMITKAAQSLLSLSVAKGLNDPWPFMTKQPENTIQNPIQFQRHTTNIPFKLPPTIGVFQNHNMEAQKNTDKEEKDEEERNPLDSDEYRRRAQELLFQTSDILLGERKDAFFELVKSLCPYINIVRSGSRTLRTYLVDTRKKKRYRTYSDAIKGGALDPLLMETGTTVLLRGCVEEAKKRFALLPKHEQDHIKYVEINKR